MAGESVGEGRSVGFLPDFADRLGAIQDKYAHRFDEFTNPFLSSQNINKSVLPWIENQQTNQLNQANLDLARQRQNLAQTAQDTILPLQAQQLGVQTSNLRGQGAAAAYNLNRLQNSDASAPEFFKQFGDAISNGDKVAAYNAIAENPEVVGRYSQQIQSGMSDLDKNSIIRQGVGIQSATQQGADAAATSKFANPEDYSASLTPLPNETPTDFQLRQSAAQQGFAQKHAQLQQIQAQSAAKIALAKIQAGGRVDSSTVRTIGELIKNGNMPVDALESVRPGLAAWATAHPGQDYDGPVNDGTIPGSQFPAQVQRTVLQNWQAVNDNPNSSQSAKDQASAMLYRVFPAFAQKEGATVQYDPVTDAQLKGIDLAEKAAQVALSKAAADPKGQQPGWFGVKSPYDQAIDTINRLNVERAQILKSSPVPKSPQSTVVSPALAATNPVTATALESENLLKSSPTDTKEILDAKSWLQAHPDDPLAASVKQKILASSKPKKPNVTRSFQVPATFGQ